MLRRWIDTLDRWLLTRQERTPAQTNWIAVTIASKIMELTHPFRLARIDYGFKKLDQYLFRNQWLIDKRDPAEKPSIEDIEPVESVGYSGSMDIGRSRLHPWLKDQVNDYIQEWSSKKWKLVVFYLEGDGMLQFRIERI
jgi:hypothetical protein